MRGRGAVRKSDYGSGVTNKKTPAIMLEIYIIRIISNIKFKKLVRKQLDILHMQQIFSV